MVPAMSTSGPSLFSLRTTFVNTMSPRTSPAMETLHGASLQPPKLLSDRARKLPEKSPVRVSRRAMKPGAAGSFSRSMLACISLASMARMPLEVTMSASESGLPMLLPAMTRSMANEPSDATAWIAGRPWLPMLPATSTASRPQYERARHRLLLRQYRVTQHPHIP